MCACARAARPQTGSRTQENAGVNDVGGGAVTPERHELDADAFLVMTDHPSRHMPNQDELAHRWLHARLERDTARRKVDDVAIDDRAVAAREAGLRFRGNASVAAQAGVVERRIVRQQHQLLGSALALVLRTREAHAEALLGRT